MTAHLDRVAEHQVRAAERQPEGFVVSCSCGWISSPALTDHHAEVRGRVHVDATRAALLARAAVELRAEMADRTEELRTMRSEARDRREQIERQRARVRAVVRGSNGGALRRQPRCRTLDLARAMAGKTVVELWVDYFAMGGDAGPPELEEMLLGARPLGRLDHDLLVCCLNERFDELGFGRPLEFWVDLHP